MWEVSKPLQGVNQLANLITHRKWHQFDLWPLIMVKGSISTNWCYVSLHCSFYETLCVKIISFVFIWGCKNHLLTRHCMLLQPTQSSWHQHKQIPAVFSNTSILCSKVCIRVRNTWSIVTSFPFEPLYIFEGYLSGFCFTGWVQGSLVRIS